MRAWARKGNALAMPLGEILDPTGAPGMWGAKETGLRMGHLPGSTARPWSIALRNGAMGPRMARRRGEVASTNRSSAERAEVEWVLREKLDAGREDEGGTKRKRGKRPTLTGI